MWNCSSPSAGCESWTCRPIAFVLSEPRRAGVALPGRQGLAHQQRQLPAQRVFPLQEGPDGALAVGGGAVLSQLELSFQPVDRDLEPDDGAQQLLHELL